MTATATATPAAPAAGVSGVLPVASYARRSKRLAGDGKGATINIADQHAQNRAYAAVHFPGAPVVEYDDNMSAWNPDVTRDDWEAMLDDTRAGQFQAVIGRYADRLTRQPEQGEHLLKACRGTKTELHTTSAGHIVSALMFRMELNMAAEESDQKSRRMTDEHRRIADRGGFHGGRRRFGYDARMTEIDPTEAAEIRNAAARILAGESLKSIAADWNARGILTPTGKEWRSQHIGKMMRGVHLVAVRGHNGKFTEASWPAILDRATHDALVRYLTRPDRRVSPEWQASRVYALSGLLRCAVCGGACYGKPYARKTGPVYTCRDGSHVYAPVAEVDALVREIVIDRLTSVDMAGALVAPADREAADRRRNERDALAGRRADIPRMVARGQFPAELVTDTLAEIDAALAEIDAADRADDDERARPLRVLDGLTGLPYDVTAARFDALPADRARAVVALLGTPTVAPAARKGVVAWDPDRVDFVWAGA